MASEQFLHANNRLAFNEDEWLRLVFLLNDTDEWLGTMIDNLFRQPPISERKKLFRNTYHLSIRAMAHIIERHYHKVQRHPGTGKFTISLIKLLEHIRDASQIAPTPIAGSENFQRLLELQNVVGFDRSGIATSMLTVITDLSGNIITSFPGTLQ